MTDLALPPVQIATQWLADFGSALKERDLDRVMGLFDADCYWRDLVSFTWNICTQEGPDAIQGMLEKRLNEVDPGHFSVEGNPTEADGVIETLSLIHI